MLASMRIYSEIQKDVLSNVAEVLDIGLQSPVPLVLVKQRMFVEETRVEAAHVMVTFHATVHNGLVSLFANTFSCNFFVDPIWISPHARVDLPKFYRRTCVVGDGFLEGGIEVAVIQKDVGIVEPSIEVPFNGLDGLHNAV